MNIELKLLHPLAEVPAYASSGAAAFDLRFLCLPGEEPSIDAVRFLHPGAHLPCRTGVAIHIADPGWGLFVYARGGLGSLKGVTPRNCVGVIDSDYQGEIMVTLLNEGVAALPLRYGDRIAQAVLAPVRQATFDVVSEFSNGPSGRGEGRFGSTGVR